MEQNKFYQIKNVTEYEYTLVGCDGSVITRPIRDIDKSASAFTINDAKDGDVLVAGEMVFIFNKIHGEWVNCHCALHSDNSLYTEDYDLLTTKYAQEIFPATKKQRDLLFAKMHDAGYAWDNEKKELKKIEPKTLDTNKVIEWMDEHVPTKFEDMQNYVNQFKKDFSL